MDKKLICITGIDGTGKSTLIKGIMNHFSHFYLASIWDLMASQAKGLPFKSKNEIDEFLCSLTPDSRLLFLSHCLKYAMDIAFENSANTILIDSYYYKYFATEKALGASEQLIYALVEAFPKPEIVIELLLPVELASQRKNSYSRYECGLDSMPGISSFIAFQNRTLLEWEWIDKTNWFKIDANQPAEKILNETLQIIS
jgi:dTMP kinase